MDLQEFLYWASGGLGAVFVLWLGQFLPRRVRAITTSTVILIVVVAAYHAIRWRFWWEELRLFLLWPFER